jgi:hypothetical protein
MSRINLTFSGKNGRYIMISRGSFFDSADHLNDEGVGLYVDALKLNRFQDLPEDIRTHVAACKSCKKRILELSDSLRQVPYPQNEKHPFLDREPRVSRGSFSSYYRFAAGIALIIGASSFLAYMFIRHTAEMHDRPSSQVTSLDSVTDRNQHKYQDSAAFASNFTECANLEGLMGSSFRSGDIRILTPMVGQAMSDTLLFWWQTDAPPPFVLRIINNREDTILKFTLKGMSYLLKRKLTPGLYYWKLESRDELLYVGKILVPQEGIISR